MLDEFKEKNSDSHEKVCEVPRNWIASKGQIKKSLKNYSEKLMKYKKRFDEN